MEEKEIQQIASLARLRLGKEESEELTQDINKILLYIDEINQLDTSSVKEVEVYFQVMLPNRPDLAKNSLNRDQVKEVAPSYENGYIVVPREIET